MAIVLDVFLHRRLVGSITELPGDRNIFVFEDGYLRDQDRPTLSLGFKGTSGGIAYQPKPRQTKVDPYFSNLLPEGKLREYIAARDNVDPEREFHLLRLLGEDLPGAVIVKPSAREGQAPAGRFEEDAQDIGENNVVDGPLKFSLAGVQMKLSAVKEASGGLTIPVSGRGGRWIVKLPSERFRSVPENEFWMLELARRVGFDVPEAHLVPMNEIGGLPSGIRTDLGDALAVKRFDRADDGRRIHTEDFAQVFRVYPHMNGKYEKGNFDMIARVIWQEVGEDGLEAYIARLVVTAAIGNGDMHLKNWSLIYPDGKTPQLAPVYDFLSTLTYAIGKEGLREVVWVV